MGIYGQVENWALSYLSSLNHTLSSPLPSEHKLRCFLYMFCCCCLFISGSHVSPPSGPLHVYWFLCLEYSHSLCLVNSHSSIRFQLNRNFLGETLLKLCGTSSPICSFPHSNPADILFLCICVMVGLLFSFPLDCKLYENSL